MSRAAALAVGHGSFDVGAFADSKRAGLNAEYLRRFNKTWSGFARGEVSIGRSENIDWSAVAGARAKW